MSRFAVLLDRDPRTDSPTDRIADDLARRSRSQPIRHDADGIRLWQAGAVGTTDARVRRSGPLTLAADLALTDLVALRSALAADPAADAGDLLLAAWLRWGEDALDRLEGAFAFVIWDARTHRLTAVRDRFGINPLIHAATPGGMILGGDLSTILSGLRDRPGIDPTWVAEFLSGHSTTMTATAWQGVTRLPPGHLMRVDQDGTAVTRAWYRLGASTPPKAGTDLHDALSHATSESCQSGPTATMLSGGLDSSSLSLLSVRDGSPTDPRMALSLRYRDPEMDEGPYIDAVVQKAAGRLQAIGLPGETDDASLFDLDRKLDWQDQPFFAPGLDRIHHLCGAARDRGCNAILDGHGGDEVIGGTVRDIGLVAAQGKWPLALTLAIRHARFTDTSVSEGVGGLLAAQGRRGFGRVGRLALRMHDSHRSVSFSGLVDPDLTRDTRLMERLRDMSRPDPRDRNLPDSVRTHIAAMAGPLSAVAFETLGRATQAEGVQALYPFYDHRVAEICVWQPPAARIANGLPRALLREAMRGVLPETVRLRRSKTNFMVGFWGALRRDPQGRVAALADPSGPLRGWANPVTLATDLATLHDAAQPDPQTAFRLWRALCLATWLERGPAPFPSVPASSTSAR